MPPGVRLSFKKPRIGTRRAAGREEPAKWEIVDLPPNPGGAAQGFGLSRISPARCHWIVATVKIALLRRLRIRWSRLGSWFNLNPRGTANPAIRDRAALVWASKGRQLLQGQNSGTVP